MSKPTAAQIEQYIKWAEDEAGPDCADDWFFAVSCHLREWIKNPSEEAAPKDSIESMTLRDNFALMAMQGLVSSLVRYDDDAYATLSAASYKIADAMLKERNK